MENFKDSPLWQNSFSKHYEKFPQQCKSLESAFDKFRDRATQLVSKISNDMPDLTVHDITHLDALWWTASEIAGEDYELNPAEAFVLGGAILLHDSAHCIAAYPGGIQEIMRLPEWKMFSPKTDGTQSSNTPGTAEFKQTLFEVLRTLHPKQARKLPKIKWKAPQDDTEMYLLPDDELREAYGEIIGQVSESHWLYPHELEKFSKSIVNPPAAIHPAPWPIDVFKICIILRTADAAHINSQRAPKFLLALTRPSETSLVHWQFQTRIHSIKRDPDSTRHEIRISGSPFPPEQQDAWWMAYDTAKMIDKELRSADRLLLDFKRTRLSARSVSFINRPEDFAQNVPTEGWQPVDASIKITDIKSIVERFGGFQLYGSDPSAALRELIQNSADAIRACRSLGGMTSEEGEIEISLEHSADQSWLSITDTGVGMSRYVLTEVLLDFGRSLWRSPDLRGEWTELLGTDFESIGKFGIGFFSIFMLGEKVKIITRRYENKPDESSHWALEFSSGTKTRPTLRIPEGSERLKRHGTKISVLLYRETLKSILSEYRKNKETKYLTLAEACAKIAPALDINVFTKVNNEKRQIAVLANDWKQSELIDLEHRIFPEHTGISNLSLTDIPDKSGTIKARLSVYSSDALTTFLPKSCMGITNGIKAGAIECFYGVINVKPQEDLARSDARPDLTLEELSTWAEDQRKKLISSESITITGSAILIMLGANPEGLIIGRLGNKAITYEDLRSHLITAKNLIIHEGPVEYDDDDRIARYEFSGNFKKGDLILEVCDIRIPSWLNETRSKNPSIRQSSPLNEIYDLVIKTWNIDDDLEFEGFDSDYQCVVGHVDGIEIERYCTVFERN